jgi:dTDP-4-dehydrorhamnose reductase
MRILVVGRGWTGNKMSTELSSRGHRVFTSSHDAAIDILGSIHVDWVVNCAGVTGVPNVDACELDQQNTISGNAIYPALLHDICERRHIRFSHFSSGCIYQGNIDSVDATPNFFGSTYSISKGISDVHLKDKAQVYRIRMPFTGIDEPKNYLTKVLKYARTGKLIDSGHNSLTDLDEAVRVACDLIETGKPNGYYNLVNSGSITMHELMDMFGMSVEWFTDEEFKAVTLADRSTCTIPAYEGMSDVKIALSKAVTNLQK